jgi:dCMP deaminase
MRPTWDEYFMSIADLAATRSPCLRRQVGAVIEKDHQVLAVGYNGPPAGFAHCVEKEEPCDVCQGTGSALGYLCEGGCPYCGGDGIKKEVQYKDETQMDWDLYKIPVCIRKQLNIPSGQRYELCRASHAEFAAICQAAKKGISIDGSTLYCTCFPCIICAKAIISAGIKTIYYKGDFVDDLSREMLEQACKVVKL